MSVGRCIVIQTLRRTLFFARGLNKSFVLSPQRTHSLSPDRQFAESLILRLQRMAGSMGRTAATGT